MKRINSSIVFCLLLVLSPAVATAQNQTSECKVLMPQITGSYEGECKNGLAEGMGKAQGIDRYEGYFKKGYPDGDGKYTWANGDIYEGKWQKGYKEGYGVLTFSKPSPDSTLKGYWIRDEYIGKDKYPYKLNHKGINVLGVNVSRVATDKDQITFEFNKNGKPLSILYFSVTEVLGGYSSIMKSDFSKTLLNVKFPFRAEIAGGAYVIDLTINQRGSWKVIINVTDK